MPHRGDYKYIQGILKNDFQVLDGIYHRFLPGVRRFVLRNSGSADEAKDVFQEALVVIFKKSSAPDFQLSASFESLLYGISRFIWLRQLKKKHRSEVTIEGAEGLLEDSNIESLLAESEKQQLFRERFQQLGDDCRQVLQSFFDRDPLGAIAQKMGYTEDYIKQKKRRCKDQLVKSIQNDRRFLELG